MILDERLITYLNSLDSGNPPYLEQLEQTARETYVPVIRKETQSLLKVLVTLKRPGSILEIGTAIGFSALLMSEYAPDTCRITTIENYEKRIPIARENIKKAGREQQITLLPGDAQQIMRTLNGPYDFVFMDAAKGQYLNFLPEAMRLLAPGGLLVSDNVLQEGSIIQSRYAIERRDRTIHTRMREYLYQLTHHQELVSAILPLGDGVAVSCKKTHGGKNETTRTYSGDKETAGTTHPGQ